MSRCTTRAALLLVVLAVSPIEGGGPPPGAAADAPAVTVEASLEPRSATIGDPLAWRITVDVPVDHASSAPVLAAGTGPFELSPGFELVEETRHDARVRLTFAARPIPFRIGTLTLPAAAVSVWAPPSSERSIPVPATSVVVASVVPPGVTLARDARDIVRRGPRGRATLVIGLTLGVVVLGAASRRLWRAWRRARLALRAPDLSPDEWAIRELKGLVAGPLRGTGQSKQFHIRLAEIARVYLARRFAFDAVELTSDELCRELGLRSTDERVAGVVRQLSERCDLVKFARHDPSPGECSTTVEAAFLLVDLTRDRGPVGGLGRPAGGP